MTDLVPAEFLPHGRIILLIAIVNNCISNQKEALNKIFGTQKATGPMKVDCRFYILFQLCWLKGKSV